MKRLVTAITLLAIIPRRRYRAGTPPLVRRGTRLHEWEKEVAAY